MECAEVSRSRPFSVADGSLTVGHSSREQKKEINQVDDEAVLETLMEKVKVYTWKYNEDKLESIHMGPIAEVWFETSVNDALLRLWFGCCRLLSKYSTDPFRFLGVPRSVQPWRPRDDHNDGRRGWSGPWSDKSEERQKEHACYFYLFSYVAFYSFICLPFVLARFCRVSTESLLRLNKNSLRCAHRWRASRTR